MKRRNVLWGAAGLVACPNGALADPIAAISEYERASGGRVGLYAENFKSGAMLSWRAGERFVMCSTFKASLAACVLSRVDQGQDVLEAVIPFSSADLPDWHAPVARQNLARGALSVREMCQASVEESDNTCASLLLSRIGGPPALTAYWRSIGDHVSRIDDPEPNLNWTPPGDERNTTTPAAMARILRRLVLGPVLSPESRALLKGWMVDCKTGGNRLRAGLPGHWVVGDKTGNNGQDAAGDIAIAWPRTETPVVVCVYTRGGSPSSRQIETVFASIGRLIAMRLF